MYEFHPDAQRELLEMAAWYASRDPRVGLRFDREVNRLVALVVQLPDAGAPFMSGTRRVLLNRFPVSLVYRVRVNRVQFVAVMHHSRRPGYWVERLD